MISEHDICELFSTLLPSGRQNACFESDAEIISLRGMNVLFSTDEFSAEDLFREDDPYALGWNIAAGAISDILACGGTPLYYAHALTVSPRWDADFLTRFAQGVRAVLEAADARFIGGDCGRSEHWRCTASVIGSCDWPPVGRRGARPGNSLYLSGPIGAGNLEAALTLHAKELADGSGSIRNLFALRRTESSVMRKYASACMDTSDGFAGALHTLADLNQCGFAVTDPPYLSGAVDCFQRLGLPNTLLCLGECGEYELLFTVNSKNEPAMLAEARQAGCAFYRVGEMTEAGRMLHQDGKAFDLSALRLSARDFTTPRQYLAALSRLLAAASAGVAAMPCNHDVCLTA